MLVGALRRPHPGQNPGIGSSNQIFKAMNVRLKQTLVRRYREIQQIARDPILMVGLLVSSSFVFLFVLWPLFKVVRGGFFDFNTGAFSLEYFDRYVDPYYAHHSWTTLRDTMVMGLSAAAGGTILGFIFAYTLVRCSFPFSRAAHALTLVPTISPPFAIAMAVILLFGRSGLVTRDWLGIEFGQGVNDVYGLDGLVFVQIITFFPVAYLIMHKAWGPASCASFAPSPCRCLCREWPVRSCCFLSNLWPTWGILCCSPAPAMCFPPRFFWPSTVNITSKKRLH